jgi:flagellar protein FliL
MAEEPQSQPSAESKPAAEARPSGQAKPAGGKMTRVIMMVVVAVSAGGGFGVSLLSAKTSLNVFSKHAAPPKPSEIDAAKLTLENASGQEPTWYSKLEPVVANLDEPGALRYIRLTVYLEMDGAAEQEKTQKFIDARKPLLNNWLQLYLAGRTLEEVKGEKYLKTMQAQILEGFNQILFPKTKSLIKGVLFGEINIQ